MTWLNWYTPQNVVGTSKSECIVTKWGNDTVTAGAGNDLIITDYGDDIIDAGAGWDSAFGGCGNDTFIHRIGENAGSRDYYDGGFGQDTLRLQLTGAEWARSDVQADIAKFLTHLGAWYNQFPSHIGLSLPFCFSSFGLVVTAIEKFEVIVDGVVLNPFDEAVTARADLLVVFESAADSVNLLANDSVPDRAGNVQLLSNSTLGTVTLVNSLLSVTQTATLSFTPNAALNSLKAGQVREETISYRVTDVDNDTSVSTVTIRVVGENDVAMIVTDGVQDTTVVEKSCAGEGDAVASGKLLVTDVDTGEAKFSAPASLAGAYGVFTFNTDTGAWTYILDQAKADVLAENQVVTESLTVTSLDGTASFTINVSVTGGFDFTIDSTTTVVNGTAGNDEIRPGAGNQTVFGGDGNDTINGGGGNDQLSGGAGNDEVSGSFDDDVVCGGLGNDLLLGNDGHDRVYGAEGNDSMFGGQGNDYMNGGDGDDRLQGDLGNDFMIGGNGRDVFIFRPASGADTISDFTVAGPNADVLDFTTMGPAFDTFAEVSAVTTNTANGALIDFGGGNSILLAGIQASALTSAQFVF